VDPASAAPLALALDAFLHVRCDLLLANADEAAVLGSGPVDLAGEVVVKRGAAGATWSDGRGSSTSPPSPPRSSTPPARATPSPPGFMRAWDAGPEAALRSGAALGAQAVATEGGRPPARSTERPWLRARTGCDGRST
jgi:sugar/nucleoside kinase (ribokinase family)